MGVRSVRYSAVGLTGELACLDDDFFSVCSLVDDGDWFQISIMLSACCAAGFSFRPAAND